MSAVAIIPARGGSQRIPRKNIRLFHGKPIIAYSIEAAKASGCFDHVIVSTDDMEIKMLAHAYGADLGFIRPAEMSVDSVGTQAVMQWVLKHQAKGFDYACCIYPCAPLLEAADIEFAAKLMRVISEPAYLFIPGILYYGKARSFVDGVPLDGNSLAIGRDPAERYIDINVEADWLRAEKLYEEMHK
jgi:pseudaminic acid cytidylyltransferase